MFMLMLALVYIILEKVMHSIQTFNTLCSVSSPVMTSIFSSKHFCDGLEEKAAADSIRDRFLIESVPKRKQEENV